MAIWMTYFRRIAKCCNRRIGREEKKMYQYPRDQKYATVLPIVTEGISGSKTSWYA